MEIKQQLKSFFTGHWVYMAVCTACKLNLFDYLQEGKTVNQLANELFLNKEKLILLLNALYDADFLVKNGDSFKVNSISAYLTENNPDSLKYACLNWGAEHLTAWQNLDFSIRTGKSSFEKIYDLPYFDYLNQNTDKLYAYHKAMYQYAKEDYKMLPYVIDFCKHKSVMDVGGSYGAALEIIKAKCSTIECFLFDLEKVISQVTSSNIKKIAGSFFIKIPIQAEAIILSRVLHDWNIEKVNVILSNCYRALPSKGTLYIIENCEDKIEIGLSLLSLNMTAMCESYERTSSQYILLAENAGFEFERDDKLNELQTILTFRK